MQTEDAGENGQRGGEKREVSRSLRLLFAQGDAEDAQGAGEEDEFRKKGL